MTELKEALNRLSKLATPGPWGGMKPTRVYYAGMEGPMMSYLYGNAKSSEGMKVSLGSERLADHDFVAQLVNAWRAGMLKVVEPSSDGDN